LARPEPYTDYQMCGPLKPECSSERIVAYIQQYFKKATSGHGYGHAILSLPHLLVVQTGTEVSFPNGDEVSHHVHSFSETKPFELALYKGDAAPPQLFDRPGVVVLGCNIHDGMLGYIVVVDTPHFAKTDEQGVALINDVPSDDYVLAAWTPRARPTALPPTQQLTVGKETVAVEIRITGRLSPPHEHNVSSLTWERY